MSEQQREQVRRFIADQVGITSTFTLIGMLSCLLAWLTKGRQA
ncbi:hypothetical protein PL981_07060 [Bifidobacterium adolescentis]|nr:hypothetical protein [Bifidobacterium adolescentis]MDB1547710.1 hypothetical protein [Bifidobacterium adolescentis]MDB1557196.1 hypothetical protein [Bifidobacterium adolescentis]